MTKNAMVMRAANRDPKKEVFWRRVIGEQGRSGLSIRAWCVQRQVRESSFFWWRRELRRRDANAPKHGTQVARTKLLVPVRVTPDSAVRDWIDGFSDIGSRGSIEILWPDQRRVRLIGPVDRQALADVLAVLCHELSPDDGDLPERITVPRSRRTSGGRRSC